MEVGNALSPYGILVAVRLHSLGVGIRLTDMNIYVYMYIFSIIHCRASYMGQVLFLQTHQ